MPQNLLHNQPLSLPKNDSKFPQTPQKSNPNNTSS